MWFGKIGSQTCSEFVASCLIVSVSLGQGASPSQTGAHETWLRLYHYSAAEFDLRAIEEDAFQTGPRGAIHGLRLN